MIDQTLRAPPVEIDRPNLGILQQAALGLGYRLTRVLLLAVAIVLARKGGGTHAGLATLLVILVAFTIQLTVAILDRPASSLRPGGRADLLRPLMPAGGTLGLRRSRESRGVPGRDAKRDRLLGLADVRFHLFAG